MSSAIILHHYPESPVSEKVRTVLGLKGLDWRSVHIPRLPPKPYLMPLTGGYRLTPVMQIGADVYCDSMRIVTEIERRFPQPTLFPDGTQGLAWGLSRWTDGPLFSKAIALVLGGIGHDLPADFAADRIALYFGSSLDLETMIEDVPRARQQMRIQFDWMEARLADGRDFMLGGTPALADACCYYLAWFTRGRYAGGPDLLSEFPKLEAWEGRILAIGHGRSEDLGAEEALAIAQAATPEAITGIDPGDDQGLKPGGRIDITPDMGGPAVAGEIVAIGLHDITIRRTDDRVGEVFIHFPRFGYRITPA